MHEEQEKPVNKRLEENAAYVSCCCFGVAEYV